MIDRDGRPPPVPLATATSFDPRLRCRARTWNNVDVSSVRSMCSA